MGRRLFVIVLGVAVAAYLLRRRRPAWLGHPAGNGGPSGRAEALRRLVDDVRERLRAGTL